MIFLCLLAYSTQINFSKFPPFFPLQERPRKKKFITVYIILWVTIFFYIFFITTLITTHLPFFITRTKERRAISLDEVEYTRLGEGIIDKVQRNPRINVWALNIQNGVMSPFLYKVLTDKSLYSYHFTKVRYLLPEDFNSCEMFADWIIHQNLNNCFILFTDKRCFAQHRFSNVHNDYIWIHKIHKLQFQNHFKNVFTSTYGMV